MVSIRFLDQFKLYEDQSGMMSYAERAIRKAVNILERSYCNHLNPSIFEGGKKRRDDSIIVSITTFPARIGYVHLADQVPFESDGESRENHLVAGKGSVSGC